MRFHCEVERKQVLTSALLTVTAPQAPLSPNPVSRLGSRDSLQQPLWRPLLHSGTQLFRICDCPITGRIAVPGSK